MGIRKFQEEQLVGVMVDNHEYLGKVLHYDSENGRYAIGIIGLMTFWPSRAKKLFPTNNKGQLPIVQIPTASIRPTIFSEELAPIDRVWKMFTDVLRTIQSGYSSDSKQFMATIDSEFNLVLSRLAVLPGPNVEFRPWNSLWRM